MAIVATGRQRNVGAVPKFLSGEWVDAVDAALTGTTLPPDLDLTVAHIVDDVAYVVRVREGRASAKLGTTDDADLVLREDYATAAALARGELTAQQAVAEGRLKLAGAVDVLVDKGPALVALFDALAAVRADTSY